MKVLPIAAAVVLATAAIAGGEVRRIRLCADPSNLPFSSQDDKTPGFEVEIARAIADSLGAEFGVHWFPAAREILALRQLTEGRCDLFMGLPLSERFTDDKPRLLFTGAYYVMRPALVAPTPGPVRALDDLASRLVGVQAMTPADHLVYERGYRRKVYLKAEEVFTALAGGEVDAAVVESPLAGWFAARNPGFAVTEIADPAREFKIGAAVRKADTELKDAVDRAIQQLQSGPLPAILARYGMPAAQPSPAQTPPLSAELRAARSTYLTQCSQCHGTDARGTPVAANLRKFKGSEADFVRVVQVGRPGTAMTPWRGLIADDDIRQIARYIKALAAE